MNIDTSGWGAFNEADPNDAACERERQAWTQYTLKRLKKIDKTGSDQAAICIGGLMAICQMAFAIHGKTPPDSARDGLHNVLDFAWLQCVAMVDDPKDMN